MSVKRELFAFIEVEGKETQTELTNIDSFNVSSVIDTGSDTTLTFNLTSPTTGLSEQMRMPRTDDLEGIVKTGNSVIFCNTSAEIAKAGTPCVIKSRINGMPVGRGVFVTPGSVIADIQKNGKTLITIE